MADFSGPFDRAALLELAARDDVQSRLVVRERSGYVLLHGPLRRRDFKALPATRWTLLVNGINRVSVEADRLLRRFAFVPFARLDDLMVSYAVEGGGVGAHVDSYDVFLLQGFGRRRWRWGRQRDVSMRPRLPLRILHRFTPQHDAVLANGDMLYLPPGFAHDGVAIDECTTYSIGFRAPSAQELAQAFLDFLQDEAELDGRYTDAGAAPTREPARIPVAMQRHAARTLEQLRWSDRTAHRFLGVYLSEPKPDVVFDPPSRPLVRASFSKRAAARGVALDLRTQMFYDDERLYINGDATAYAADRDAMRALADLRALSARGCSRLSSGTLDLLHDWYKHGFIGIAA
ncbi:MAG TPA: cupin domain-containing protein [Casimicrobiaceae bacterium]|nr:cupin domain-containing protein [Casimicrobiaceae bacterium]